MVGVGVVRVGILPPLKIEVANYVGSISRKLSEKVGESESET